MSVLADYGLQRRINASRSSNPDRDLDTQINPEQVSMSEPNQNRPESNHEPSLNHEEEIPREEILGSLLERTKHFLEDDSCHGFLTDHVRDNRMTSIFDFDNVCELVRCVLGRTTIKKLPIDHEECVIWIANCIYEDPLSNERTETLWISIVSRIQNQQ